MISQGLNAQRFTLSDSSEPDLCNKHSNRGNVIFDSVRTEVVNPEPEPGMHDLPPRESTQLCDKTESKPLWSTLMPRRLWGCRRLTFLITLPLVISYVIGQYFPSVRMPQKLIGTLCTPMGIICSCALPDLFTPLSAINCNADYYHSLCDGHEVRSPPTSNALSFTPIMPATSNTLAVVPSSTAATPTASNTMMWISRKPDEPDALPRNLVRDFGLAEGGAKVVSGLTSPTEGLGSLSYAAGLLAVLRGYDKTQMHINPPLVVLEEQLSVSNCWKFHGSHGHITVSLEDTIAWTHFTLHFPDYLESDNSKLRQAPKVLIMRALVLKSEVEVENLSLLTSWERFVTVDHLFDSSLFNSSSAFVDVARVFYTPSKGGHQTFPTQIPVQTSIVLIEIMDNWGDPSTCIHRISFHGHKGNSPEFAEAGF
ncbi:hypothetical protein EV361DRAFT_953510 [Lentinula raphanica]|nr:hypothetical protein F5880DRAFT_1616024 [Lentinula raphanica]KAJ3967100.1 hypothetical protein EV361DRAFT_953510 [Lentinula raphanica]